MYLIHFELGEKKNKSHLKFSFLLNFFKSVGIAKGEKKTYFKNALNEPHTFLLTTYV